MDDYEIALKKWAWQKVCKDTPYGSPKKAPLNHRSYYYIEYGFHEGIHWSDIRIDEFFNDGYQDNDPDSYGSFDEAADAGFEFSLAGKKAYKYSTKYELGKAIYEISHTEITDEDRELVNGKR